MLDASIEEKYRKAVTTAIENDADNRISNLHIWKIGANHYAAIVSIVTHQPNSAEHYKAMLSEIHQLSHITIEVNVCDDKLDSKLNANIE